MTRGKVVVACAEREWHALPALIISSAMRLHGWRTVLLGASTSPARLSQCLHDTGPDATAISCSVLGALPTTRRFIEASTTAGIPVLVGGSAFGHDATRALALGATAWAPDAHSAVALLDGLPAVVPRAAPLPRESRAEQAALELDHHRLVEVLRGRWSPTATASPNDALARKLFSAACGEVLHQALHAVSATLLTGDPRPIPETAAWIDRLLSARGARPAVGRRTRRRAGLRAAPLSHRTRPRCPVLGRRPCPARGIHIVNELSFTVERETDRVVVVTTGVVTIGTSGEFEQALLALAADTDLVVDLRAVDFVDSSGLSVLVAACKEGRKHGNADVLDEVPPFLSRVLKVTGLGAFLLAPQQVR